MKVIMEVIRMAKKNTASQKGKRLVEGRLALPPVKNKLKTPKMKPPKKD